MMSAKSELALLLGLTERLSPKCCKSRLWRRARDSALEAAARADRKAGMWQDDGACDGSFGEILCEEEPVTKQDLINIGIKHLGRPLRCGSKIPTGKARIKGVKPSRSRLYTIT